MLNFLKKISLLTLMATCTINYAHCMLTEEQQQSPSLTSESQTTPAACLGQRPTTIQQVVDEKYEKIRSFTPKWGHAGKPSYQLLGADENQLLPFIANLNPEKKEIYIIDVGCANAAWGTNAMHILHKTCSELDKHFYIFSITGGRECTRQREDLGNVSHITFNQCKIENIAEAFPELANKVDLIVSSYTLRHLVDPFGTLKQLYHLLSPTCGILISDGFTFFVNDSPACQMLSDGNLNILAMSNAETLFGNNEDYVSSFLLMKTNVNELELPIEYTGCTATLPGLSLSIFTRAPMPTIQMEQFGSKAHFQYIGDRKARKLYTFLKEKLVI